MGLVNLLGGDIGFDVLPIIIPTGAAYNAQSKGKYIFDNMECQRFQTL